MLRVSSRTREFVRQWRDENRLMLASPEYHKPWKRRYAGINQAALGKLFDDGVPGHLGLHAIALPCGEWNCEDTTWEQFGPDTRIVHVKSGLRRAVFHLGATSPRLKPLVRIWRAIEREAGGCE